VAATTSTELSEFVREALARNVPRAEIEAALLNAGWGRDLVRSALAAYADVDFPVPVPRPPASLSAREAFLYLLLFTTLYISAYSFGAAVFAYIDRAFPDPAVRWNEAIARLQVRWALSALIVAFPVFAYLSTLVGRQVRRDPAKRRSNVRRWLMYLTVFVAASVLIGDFTTLVYNALGGELTTRFVLKVLTVAAIGGTILAYYLTDLRLEDSVSAVEHPAWTRALGTIAALGVIAAVAGGLFVIGAPGEERARRLDARRVEDLRAIAEAARVYYGRHGTLPGSVGELTREGGLRVVETAETGAYEYRVTGADTFEVCATFQHDSTEQPGLRIGDVWAHAPGRQCFPIDAKPETGRVSAHGR
jgi:hypothetical protein